jgi:hypothetical protein
MTSKQQKSKRGPGRPPKAKPGPVLAKKGIVDNPADSANRMELVYGDPMMFKSLFAFFQKLKSKQLHVRFDPESVTIFTRDDSKKCRVVAKIPGNGVHHYYCDDAFWLGITRDKDVEKIFATIDKTLHKVTLLYSHDDPDSISIIFKDCNIDKECNYRLTVSAFDPDEELFMSEKLTTPESLKTFPIEFKLTSKQFKKTVTDAQHHSTQLTVEKLGKTRPLQFTYHKSGLRYNEVYRSGEKIELRSEVKEGTIFRCTVNTAYVKSLAAAMVTDTIRIYCRQDDDMLFRSSIDALVMSTFVKIDKS